MMVFIEVTAGVVVGILLSGVVSFALMTNKKVMKVLMKCAHKYTANMYEALDELDQPKDL